LALFIRGLGGFLGHLQTCISAVKSAAVMESAEAVQSEEALPSRSDQDRKISMLRENFELEVHRYRN
jgi:hypothetical protein